MIETFSLIDKQINELKKRLLNIENGEIDLESIIKKYLSQESKMIRSVVSILYFGGSITEEQYLILTATELIHNASLIHDDTIDGSLTRRRERTLNCKYDNRFAVIAGDYLITLAVKQLLKLNNLEVLQKFTDTISKMCIGESMQYFSKNKIPTLDEYLEKTQYKTAELFDTCLETVSFYSDIKYNKFGLNFGIAFQIKNDLDDYRKGINLSQDIKDGIYTAPVILLNSVEYSETAIEKTLGLIDNYCRRAKSDIESMSDNKYKRRLVEIIDNLCS